MASSSDAKEAGRLKRGDARSERNKRSGTVGASLGGERLERNLCYDMRTENDGTVVDAVVNTVERASRVVT